MGFAYRRIVVSAPPGAEQDLFTASIPFWFVLLTIVTASWRLWGKNPAKVREGFCRTCGYDLRGTPLRCPECGGATDGITLAPAG